MNKNSIMALILILLVFSLVACNFPTTKQDSVKEHPFDLVSTDYQLESIELPDGWDIVGIEEDKKTSEVFVYFGVMAEENIITNEEIEKMKGGSRNPIYVVSSNEIYGLLTIKNFRKSIDWEQAVLETPIPLLEEYKTVEVNGTDVKFLFEKGDNRYPWYYLWLSDNKQLSYKFFFENRETHDVILEHATSVLEEFVRLK